MTNDTSVKDILDIVRLVERERAARDRKQWEALLDCYHPDARVTLSWYDGDPAGFVEGSRQMASSGTGSVHLVGFPDIEINGDRALADTGCTINIRQETNGVLTDTVSFARHRSRIERRDGAWRLLSFYAIYQRDSLAPVIDGQDPQIDAQKLLSFRPSYMYLSYLLSLKGIEINPDLPGTDRPETVEPLIAEDAEWLSSDPQVSDERN